MRYLNISTPTLPMNLQEYNDTITTSDSVLLNNLVLETKNTMPMARMICGQVTGQLLGLLTRLTKAKTVLEIGTFTGYSALHMASNLSIDGHLITLDRNRDSLAIARKYFALSPHGHKITIMDGNAMDSLDKLVDTGHRFDLVFIDADKSSGIKYYEYAKKMLNLNGIIVVDNAIYRGQVLAPVSKQAKVTDTLNRMIANDNSMQNLILLERDGIHIAQKIK